MAEEQNEVVEAVRLVLSDGSFHSHEDIYGQVAMQLRARPRWQAIAVAAHTVGVVSGYVIKP